MSYEYNKHRKKSWGQPAAFRLPPTQLADGSQKQMSILHFKPHESYMYICAKGGREVFILFQSLSTFLFVVSRARRWVPLLACVLQVSLDFEGGVFCTASFAPLQPSLFFLSGSHDPREGGW